MTIISGPFRSINGDRKFNVEWFTLFFSSFIGNGIFPNPSTNLQVLENGNMTTVVKSGRAWANGHFMYSDTDVIIEHDIADGLLNRIDRIVVRLDFVTRKMAIELKKGIFASSPVAPTLQRDSSAYELALADVYIGAGAIEITQANITDQRLNNEVCGIVHGTVDQIDTTTLFNQYQTWLNEKKTQYDTDMAQWTTNKQTEYQTWYDTTIATEQQEIDDMEAQFQADWDYWFNNVKSQLSGDVAGSLQAQIDSIEGEGRTTETVKGNAEAIANHLLDKNNPHGITASQVGAVPISEKGQPNGIASLDTSGKVPTTQLPEMNYIPTSEKGVAGGVVTYDANGNILKADGTILSGGVWGKIAEITLNTNTAQIDFSDIPSDYKHLKVIFDAVSSTSSSPVLGLKFNDDASNYFYQRIMSWNNSSLSGAGSVSQSNFIVGYLSAAGQPFSKGEVDISNISPTKDKTVHSKNFYQSGTLTTELGLYLLGGSWKNKTDPITKISLYAVSGSIGIGSKFTLMGMK